MKEWLKDLWFYNSTEIVIGTGLTFLVLLIVFIAFWCVPSKSGPSITVIDGCEYFKYGQADGFSGYTHKGNCTNVIHWHNRAEDK